MGVAVLERIGNIVSPSPEMVAETVPLADPEFDRPGPDTDNGVRKMTTEEIPQTAQSLAEAFAKDPHFAYIINQHGEQLIRRLGQGIATFLEHNWLPKGEVYTHDKQFGAAIWAPPGQWHDSPIDQFRLLPALAGKTGPADIFRLLNVLGFVENKHKEIEHKFGEHYYLAMLGVTPEWQGKGWGDALMKPVLERCDEEGVPAYLEASTPRNVPLYERNGFEVIAKGHYRGATELLHFMWREPAD